MKDLSSDILDLAQAAAGKSAATWITPAEPFTPPSVFAFRLKFRLKSAKRVRFHVTADERYSLFFDGRRIGRGPERGDARNWFYHTHELRLAAGEHVFVAQVWALGAQAPLAQISVRPGFLLIAEGAFKSVLSTGVAPWEAMRLGGFRFKNNGGRLEEFYCVGDDLEFDGGSFPWGVEQGHGTGWKHAVTSEKLTPALDPWGHPGSGRHVLRPGLLPLMLDRPVRVGEVRHAEKVGSLSELKKPVRAERRDAAAAQAWGKLLLGSHPIRLAAGTRWRVLVDLQNYYCAYPQITVSGGKGSRITLRWAESLYEDLAKHLKGNRGQIEGKYFNGIGDVFLVDGGKRRLLQTLWWRAGRYLQFEIEVGASPLVIEDFHYLETRYPLEAESRFECDEPRMTSSNRIALRTLQMCAHETYMDCPYYEQLMYIGDARLEILTQYAVSRDDRLPRKALEMFDLSRDVTGFTASRHPVRDRQVIPPFSLWWIGCIHDYATWRNDPATVKERLPGARAVIDAWLGCRNRQGLVEMPPGWNYTDWVPGWIRGTAPVGKDGLSSPIQWQVVLALDMLAELEAWCGEPELAAWAKRQAADLAKKITAHFWNARRGLFANDTTHRFYCEHSQCLAVLSGRISAGQRNAVRRNLPKSQELGLEQTTIYFSHYLFETCRTLGLEKMWFARLQPWLELEGKGFKTTYEFPEPGRSDCHAWGAYPLFHSHASILGVRPVGFGFHTVEIAPSLGPLHEASGALVHPRGTIRTHFVRRGTRLEAEVTLPSKVEGTLVWKGKKRKLTSGGKASCIL